MMARGFFESLKLCAITFTSTMYMKKGSKGEKKRKRAREKTNLFMSIWVLNEKHPILLHTFSHHYTIHRWTRKVFIIQHLQDFSIKENSQYRNLSLLHLCLISFILL